MDKEKIIDEIKKVLMEIGIVAVTKWVIDSVKNFLKKFNDKNRTIDDLFKKEEE